MVCFSVAFNLSVGGFAQWYSAEICGLEFLCLTCNLIWVCIGFVTLFVLSSYCVCMGLWGCSLDGCCYVVVNEIDG